MQRLRERVWHQRSRVIRFPIEEMITEIRAKQEEFMQPVTALLGVLVFASYLGNQCLD